MAHFAQHGPGYHDELLLIDSTPVACGRSRETAKRSALGDAAGYGYCAAHSRWFWGLRLHALCAPDGTPRALTLADPRRDEREVGLELLERCARHGGEVLVCDKGYAGREFALAAADLGATVVRPKRGRPPRATLPDSLACCRTASFRLISRCCPGVHGHPTFSD